MAGFGVLKLQNWARLLAFFVAGVSVAKIVWLISQVGFAIVILGLYLDTKVILGNIAYPLSWSSLLIWYFLRPGVKSQFVKGRRSS